MRSAPENFLRRNTAKPMAALGSESPDCPVGDEAKGPDVRRFGGLIVENKDISKPYVRPLERVRLLGFTAIGLALALSAPVRALAADAAPANNDATKNEVVINGVPYKETVLPTRLQNESTYGIDLNVMETPRSTTLLSTTQLETLNIDDPRAFSYLTSSSYTDAAFGTPNIPRVRTQYADVFYNGMRDSLSQNGYGVPINYDAFANIDITKGPANVVDGPGTGVGGSVDFQTKRPNLDHSTGLVDATLDTVNNRRLTADYSVPIIKDVLAVILSYSGEDSGSYFTGHWMHKNALYAALRWEPTDNYTLDVNGEVNVEQYTENVGVNRANQALINSGTYLTGSNDPADNFGFGTFWDATGSTKIDPKTTIDATPGTTSRGVLYNFQAIQKYKINSSLTLENNTLYMFQNSDNHEFYYYADNSNGSYTLENKTDLKGDYNFDWGGNNIRNQFVIGGSVRYAHTNYIANFNNEAVSVWDLATTAPRTWKLDPSEQSFGNAVPFTSVFGTPLYGVTGRDLVGGGNTGVSNLYDIGVFAQDRIVLTPQLSILAGARFDTLQDHTHDPLNCSPDGTFTCLDLPADHTTGVYGLGSANVSVVYRWTPQFSTYATFDWVQTPPPSNGGEGGINAYGIVPDSKLLRANSFLYEAGAKFNLLDNKLFISTAVFDQTHQVPTGPGDTLSIDALTRGVELEANYQPNRNLYITGSYSFLKTTLDSPPGFYDFPAQPGINVDGGGAFLTPDELFLPGQKVDQPDQPQHLINFLANYKTPLGVGFRTGLQVTGPIPLTASAYINTAALNAAGVDTPNSVTPVAGKPGVGYYQSPIIPWQYTWNLAAFYEWKNYTVTVSVYNVTDRHNWAPSPGFYGNDFLVLSDPRTYELRLQAKF